MCIFNTRLKVKGWRQIHRIAMWGLVFEKPASECSICIVLLFSQMFGDYISELWINCTLNVNMIIFVQTGKKENVQDQMGIV